MSDAYQEAAKAIQRGLARANGEETPDDLLPAPRVVRQRPVATWRVPGPTLPGGGVETDATVEIRRTHNARDGAVIWIEQNRKSIRLTHDQFTGVLDAYRAALLWDEADQ